MSRLNKKVRLAISENWVKAKWKERLDKGFEEASISLVAVFESENQERIKIAKDHPELRDYLSIHNSFHIDYGIVDSFNLITGYAWKSLDCQTYVNENRYGISHLETYGKDSPELTAKRGKIRDIVAKYNKMALTFSSELSILESVLASVPTIKKLINLSPEIEKYLPDIGNGMGTQLMNAGDLVRLKGIL